MAKKEKQAAPAEAETQEEAPFLQGPALEQLVERFEKMVKVVDDHYMHHGQGATDEGVPFTLVAAGLLGGEGNHQVMPFASPKDALLAFERELEAFWLSQVVPGQKNDYLAWRDRPRYESAEGGVIVRCRLALHRVQELSKETQDRLKP